RFLGIIAAMQDKTGGFEPVGSHFTFAGQDTLAEQRINAHAFGHALDLVAAVLLAERLGYRSERLSIPRRLIHQLDVLGCSHCRRNKYGQAQKQKNIRNRFHHHPTTPQIASVTQPLSALPLLLAALPGRWSSPARLRPAATASRRRHFRQRRSPPCRYRN